MTPNMRPMNGTPQSGAGSSGATAISNPVNAAQAVCDKGGCRGGSAGLRRLARTPGRAVYDRTHRGVPVGVRRFVGVLALGVAGLGVASCAPSSETDAVSGGQSTVERQMSGEYILNPDGTLSKIPVYVHEPELQSNAYTYSEFGAEQAAKHYLALIDYAWETGDTQPMSDFATDECTVCTQMVSFVDSVYSDSGWTHGLKYRVDKVLYSDEVRDIAGIESTIGVAMEITRGEGDIYSQGTLEHRDAKQLTIGMFLAWDGSNWKVSRLSTISAEGGQSAL